MSGTSPEVNTKITSKRGSKKTIPGKGASKDAGCKCTPESSGSCNLFLYISDRQKNR